ncbi:hypothetical protein SODALDRAFT_351155 [Sodiomyces alkalinus F11]|uniref:Mid2 domain-containing protein n=1 Tax=Sodiomyces alkalinus (strain CBS 110278 / VKM F-3762 / F11) TaxID=1314773 RepID=A0A3N2PTZ6_SODAK|nr:hypothetical protein SODALDRAFT_351155 [Sodiomyces alkalinus F11]ROT37979.1 hypothetical protein SODALDRAFT_351155 [Sodiomyces alkalinus F11]
MTLRQRQARRTSPKFLSRPRHDLPRRQLPPGAPPGENIAELSDSDSASDSEDDQTLPSLPPSQTPPSTPTTRLPSQGTPSVPGVEVPPPIAEPPAGQQPAPEQPAGNFPGGDADDALLPPIRPITTFLVSAPSIPTATIQPPAANAPVPVEPTATTFPLPPVVDVNRPVPSAEIAPPTGLVPPGPAPTSSQSPVTTTETNAVQPTSGSSSTTTIPDSTSIAPNQVSSSPTGDAQGADQPSTTPAPTGGDADRGVAVGITFGIIGILAVLIAIGVFIYKKMHKNKPDVEAPPVPSAARPQSIRTSRIMSRVLIAHDTEQNDAGMTGYYSEKQGEPLPPMPQTLQPVAPVYGNHYQAYRPVTSRGLPIAQMGPDGRYVG